MLSRLLKPLGNWLDTCCGQGWHLAQFPSHQRMGIDMSAAQLEQARVKNPGVPFIQADIADYEPPEGRRFDLVSNFWSGFSYLNDEGAIRAVVEKLVRWTAPGGALYLEMNVPERLENFNDGEFAAETGTRIYLRSPDGVHWDYHDAGGVHRMMSPPLEFFTGLISQHFAGISHEVVVGSVRQLVAWGRRPDSGMVHGVAAGPTSPHGQRAGQPQETASLATPNTPTSPQPRTRPHRHNTLTPPPPADPGQGHARAGATRRVGAGCLPLLFAAT